MLNYFRSLAGAVRNAPFSYGFGVLGLSLAITFFVLAMGYVQFESQYDRWVPDHERIFRVETLKDKVSESSIRSVIHSGPTEEFAEHFFDVPGVRRSALATGTYFAFEHRSIAYVPDSLQVDQGFVELFNIGFLAGDIQIPDAGTVHVALSDRLATEVFGSSGNALGQVITRVSPAGRSADAGQPTPRQYVVTGVFADWRNDSHLALDALLMSSNMRASVQVFLELSAGSDLSTVAEAINELTIEGIFRNAELQGQPREVTRRNLDRWGYTDREFEFTPIADIHLQSELSNQSKALGNAAQVSAIRIAAWVLLLLGTVNFAGLLSTRNLTRLHEFAVRKVSGASTHRLAIYAIGEVLFFVAIAAALAGLMVYLLNNDWQTYLGSTFDLRSALFGGLWKWLLIACVLILVVASAGPLAGIYRLQPSAIFGGVSRNLLQLRPLVVLFVAVQVSLTVIVLVAVLTAAKQWRHVSEIDLSADIIDVFYIYSGAYSRGRNSEGYFAAVTEFESRIRAYPGVDDVASGGAIPGSMVPDSGIGFVDGKGNEDRVHWAHLGRDYLDFYGVPIIAGRALSEVDFDRAWTAAVTYAEYRSTDPEYQELASVPKAVLVNRQVLKRLGIEDPADALGHVFAEHDIDPDAPEGVSRSEIVGVVPNLFHEWHYGEVSRATVYIASPRGQHSGFSVRYTGTNRGEFEQFVGELHEEMFPEYRRENPGAQIRDVWVNEAFQAQLEPERRRSQMYLVLGALVVFIVSLGLYDAVKFTAAGRRREMAIRKVFGASTTSIVKRVMMTFLVPVALANLVAWPIAYVLMEGWLSTYSTRISLGPSNFLAATLVSLVITLLTVGREALHAGKLTPSRGLISSVSAS